MRCRTQTANGRACMSVNSCCNAYRETQIFSVIPAGFNLAAWQAGYLCRGYTSVFHEFYVRDRAKTGMPTRSGDPVQIEKAARS